MRKKPTLLVTLILCGAILSAQSTIEELKKTVVDLGKLPFKRDVPVRYFNRSELRTYLDQLFAADYPDELARKEEAFLQLLGFTDSPLQLKSLRSNIILENLGGLYNEKTKELLALEEFRQIDTINMLALVHELRHAIQDQYFNVAALLGDYSDYDDRRLAVLAALEGDATFVMIRAMGFNPEMISDAFDPGTILSLSSLTGSSALSGAPDIVKYQLLMPYTSGLKFCCAVFSKKKWRGLNSILQQPPQSSEQILHPDKYLHREAPQAVSIAYQPRQAQLFHSGVVGEYYINILLKSGSEVNDIAAGWGGDRFVVFKGGDFWMLVWKSIWDSEADGSRFQQDFRRFLEKKYQIHFQDGRTGEKTFQAGQSPAGFFFLRRNGNHILYIRCDHRGPINDFISGGQYDD